MKAVLASIKPLMCRRIAEGEKSLEMRKSRPRAAESFRVYIYCTKDGGDQPWWNGRVIGEFVCDRVIGAFALSGGRERLNTAMLRAACLTEEQLLAYAGKAREVYGWHIRDPAIYDTPLAVTDFWRMCPEYDERGPNCWDCERRCGDDEVDCGVDGRLYLTRPPQSWQYVEEIKRSGAAYTPRKK